MLSQHAHKFVAVIILMLFVVNLLAAGEKRPITVEDCVQTKRVVTGEVKLSLDGLYVAYVMKSPEIATNRNNYQLYVRDLKQKDHRDNGKLILSADLISGIQWLNQDRLVLRTQMNAEQGPKSEVKIINILTGARETLDLLNGIDHYSISTDGDTIVYSVKSAADKRVAAENEAKRKAQALYGYPITFGQGDRGPELNSNNSGILWESEVFISKRTKDGKFGVGNKLFFKGPGSLPRRSVIASVGRLNLSPDGRYLLLVFQLDNAAVPTNWAANPLIKWFRKMGPGASFVLGLYDVQSEQLRLGFDFPGGLTATEWSQDSRAYAVVAPSPINSAEGKKEAEDGIRSGNLYWHVIRFSHVFVVDPRTDQTTRVLSRDSQEPGDPKFEHDIPLLWEHADGEMLVRADEQTIVRMKFEDGTWKEIDRFPLQGPSGTVGSSLASDGKNVVAVYQSTTVPPDLAVSDLQAKQTDLLTDLNPEFRNIRLGRMESLDWKNKYRSAEHGLLLKPVDYSPAKRYPLVILVTYPGDEFVSDIGYTTAFPPQSLANAGFLVLFAKYSSGEKSPKNEYPGDMATAYDWMSMIESAIDLLAERGQADKNNVGIIGFSRTSWLTDFGLTHSTYHFTAASSADSGIYTYSGYFSDNSVPAMKTDESQVGGPPFGSTFKNWLSSAPPFNAGAVDTPILMEFTAPIKDAYEFFISLARQGKPVELFSYPKGAHPEREMPSM